MVRETEILGAGGVSFPNTPWTAILAGMRRGLPVDAATLEALARLYWRPVYFWFRYRWKRSPEDAKDLTQDLFAQVLSPEVCSTLDPERGRLRVYLKAAADNLVRHQARDAHRAKRGGGRTRYDLGRVDESRIACPKDRDACERLYDAEWARAIVERSLDTLRGRLRLAGKEEYADVLKLHDLAPAEPPTYEETAGRFGLTVDQVRNHLRYARSLLRSIVREYVRQSVADPADVDGEYARLFQGPGLPGA